MNFLFYDDSPVFGGHEVMTLLGVEAVLADPAHSVRFLASESNATLQSRLLELQARYPRLEVQPVALTSSKLEALKNRLLPWRVASLAGWLEKLRPHLVVAVQGNIEHSSLAMLASRRAKLRCASYIPVPHTHAQMGAKLGALRDLTASHLFRAPDAFVTISPEMAAMLQQRGAKAPIEVVYNGVDTARFSPRDQQAARDALGLPAIGPVFGMVGRVEFKQKQQHLLVQAVAGDAILRESCHLVFAGDGPDGAALDALVAEAGLKDRVTRLPWSDPAGLYPALNALVIPSRYEGLPLVMLEALSCDTAVLGSDRDGMRDVLPPEWRFRPDDSSSLAAALQRFIDLGMPPPAPGLLARIRNEMSLEAFAAAFRQTLEKLAAK